MNVLIYHKLTNNIDPIFSSMQSEDYFLLQKIFV